MGSERAVLQAHGLGFAYGSRQVLEAVDLELRAGEVVGLLGPNGSGKSTLLKVLSGVLPGYSGSASLDGHELRALPRREIARTLAVVPQETSFGFPWSALEVVLMGRHPHLGRLAFESAHDLEIARLALARCGAAAFENRGVLELSSGERQRVVLARALAQEPRVLLLDEPTSFLDVRHQVEIYELVRKLAAEHGMAVLTVLHELNLAAEYCDRIYLLHRGRIEAAGETEEVLTWANLTRVFETDLYVGRHELTGKLLVVPLSERARARIAAQQRAAK